MKTKTNRTLRKIFSIALCLVLVMSYVPMVSITASAADDYVVVDTEAGTVTIDGTLGGKTTATKDEVNALVEQLKAYVDNGITTIIVPGTEHAMYESALGTIPAYAEALYLLTDLNKDIPYCGTIDLILPDATEIIDFSFDSVDALKSITLPKVTTVGDGAFYGCRYLEKMTFGSVITEVVEIKSGVFVSLGIKSDNEACDLVLNCEQLNAEDKYKPNLESNVWYIGEWSGETEWKSITFGTHVSGEDGTCDCGAGVVAEVEYGDTATYYATLADALAVAQYRSGANVYALADCNDDFTIPASVSFYGGDNSFGGNVTNKGYIREGTFNGEVTNNGDIRGGTFNGEVTNEDFILVGTFNGIVINHEIIDGGTFNGNVINYDRIYNDFDVDRFTLGDDFTIENHSTISCDYHHWKDGVCRLCAYACTHAEGTDATCTSGPICSVCGHEYGEALGHTIVEDSYADNSNGTHSFTCSVCGNVTEEHSGGTATCTTQAVCEACGVSYGDVDLTKHDETVEYENGLCPNGCYQPATLNADGYYEIGNVGNLFWLAEQVNYGSLTKFNAVLTSDLIIPDSKQWMPINLPDGIQNASVFDGNGHSITLNQSSGLFSRFNYSVFCNVILYGTVTANTTGNIGAVVGSAYRTTIQNVISYVDVTNSNGNAGGLAGYFGGKHSDEMYSKIENCAVYADISGTNTGGLIGEGWNGTQYFDIANCTYVGDITGTNAGAIVGYQNTDSNTCVFTNIYWCEADGIGFYGKRDTSNQVYTNTMAKTPEQFASGEVAYLLQSGNVEQIWGQMSNTEGSLPIITDNELYKVVTVGETGNYSVANVGDTNGDGTVDVVDYQALVNKALADDHEQIETASYDDIVKYDLDGDGYLDVIDAYLLHLFINGFTTVDVYAVGDYDLNGKAFEEADIFAMAEAMKAPEDLETHEKYACDINGDGKVSYDDLNTLTSMFPLYFVGEA